MGSATSKRLSARLTKHVALLRGINVGGKNKLPMSSLVQMFHDAGCTSPHSYIQSGNVLFSASPALAPQVPQLITKAIAARYGYNVPVITRTVAELADIPRRNPFPDAVVVPQTVHVLFLARKPSAAAVRKLDPQRSPPDRFVVDGNEIYTHCPNGVARTKLTHAYFDAALQTTSTARNWKTVLKLIELSQA